MTRGAATTGDRRRRGHAVRVAAVAALLIGLLYAVVTVTFDLVDAGHLVGQVDARLRDSIVDASGGHHERPGAPSGRLDVAARDVDAPPVLLWRVDRSGRVLDRSGSAPALPRRRWPTRDVTAELRGGTFRLLAARRGRGWLVVGQSLTDIQHAESGLALAEILSGPVLVAAMFLGALAIGLKASAPIEDARRRQLEFTADASHELRTPLSVIEAEVTLALDTPGDADRYRDALRRVGRENRRLRRIVEDLLLLARFDLAPPPPPEEPVDLATVAAGCADRFSSVATARGIELSVLDEAEGGASISAPPEWVDQLVGVLVDNACRYAGPGGTVRLVLGAHGGRVSLVVEDSGPGIPPEERDRLFDRFHRATEEGTGAGLGLAIADAVVRATGGRWRVGRSTLGGARMEVSWRGPLSRWSPPTRAADPPRPEDPVPARS